MTAIDQLHQHRIEELISENRRTIQKEIAVALGIFKDRGEHIIGVLGFRKSLCQMGYRARQRQASHKCSNKRFNSMPGLLSAAASTV